MDVIVGLFLGYVALCVVTAKYGGGESLGTFFSLFHPTSETDAERRRAAGGLGMLLIAGALAWHGVAQLGGEYWQWSWKASVVAIDALRNGTADKIPPIVGMLAGAAAVIVFLIIAGVFRLLVGWRRSRGPRDMVAAVKALFWLVAAAILLAGSQVGARWAFLHDDWSYIPTINAWLPVFYLWLLVKAAARLFLTLRGVGGGARKLLDKEIRQTAITWRPATRQQF